MTKLTVAVLLAAAALAGAAAAQAPKPQSLVDKELPTTAPVGVVDLGPEFDVMKGYVMQQTVNTVPVGWGRAEHSHKGAPEIVHVISGVLTDQRIGGQQVKYGPGSTLINDHGLSHMWANFGPDPVVMVNTSVRVKPPAAAPK